MAKVLGFSIQINGTDQAVSTSEELRRAIAEIRNELKKAGDTDSIKKLEKQLVDLKARQNEVNKEIREEVKARQAELRAVDDVDGAYSKLSKQLIENRRRYKDLAAAGKENTEEGKALIKTVQALDKQLKDIDASVGQYQRNVGNYASAFDALIPNLAQFREGLKGVKEQASGSGKALAVAALAFEAFRIIGGLLRDATEDAKVFRDVAGQIASRFEVTEQQVKDSTGTIIALTKLYGDESREIINSTNALVKEFGISVDEATALIEVGYRKGANAQGDFLDQLREYPAQFAAAGGSATEFIDILIKAQEEGIYSDKGIDAVKEFGLRIREQTKATKAALEGAFGEQFTSELFKGINNGSITTVEALRRVGKGLQDTSLTAKQVQTVIADTFGGPGEDAGLRFLQLLGDINTEIEGVSESTNEYQSQQFELFQATEELSQVQADFALALGNAGTEIELLKTRAKTFLAEIGRQLLQFFNELPATIEGARRGVSTFLANAALIPTQGFSAFKNLGRGVLTAYNEGYLEKKKEIDAEDAIAATVREQAAKAEKEAESRAKGAGKKTGEAFIEGSIAAIEKEKSRLEKAINEAVAGSGVQGELVSRLKEQERLLAKAVAEKNRLLLSTQRDDDQRLLTQTIQAGEIAINQVVSIEKKKTDVILAEVGKRQFAIGEALQAQIDYENQVRQEGLQQLTETSIQGAFDLVNAFSSRASELRNRAFEEQISNTEANIQALEERAQGASRLRKRQLQKQIEEEKKLLEKQRADAEAERAKQAKNEKKFAILQSIIQGALAVQRALAQVPGPPFTIPQAIATGIFAAVQTATIAAQPLATGGVVGLSGQRINARQNIPTRSNGDNVLATVKRGEVVLNQQQQAALGGAQTFRSIGVPGFATGGAVSAPITAPIISTNRAALDFSAAVAALDRKTDAINQRLDKLRAYVVSEDVARDLQEGENIKINATL